MGAGREQHQSWGRGSMEGTAAPPCITPWTHRLPPCRGRQDTSQHTPAQLQPVRLLLQTCMGDPNWRERERREGKGGRAGGAWGQDGRAQGGRKGHSLRQQDPSLFPSFPPRKKKKRKIYSLPAFFSQRPWPPLVKPHLKPPRHHGNRPGGTDGPSQPNPNGREAGCGTGPCAWGDRAVTPLALVLWPWRDICGLGGTSGWPRRREGRGCSPPEGTNPLRPTIP